MIFFIGVRSLIELRKKLNLEIIINSTCISFFGIVNNVPICVQHCKRALNSLICWVWLQRYCENTKFPISILPVFHISVYSRVQKFRVLNRATILKNQLKSIFLKTVNFKYLSSAPGNPLTKPCARIIKLSPITHSTPICALFPLLPTCVSSNLKTLTTILESPDTKQRKPKFIPNYNS